MTSDRTGSRTDANLLVALFGEADANRGRGFGDDPHPPDGASPALGVSLG